MPMQGATSCPLLGHKQALENGCLTYLFYNMSTHIFSLPMHALRALS